MKTKQPTTVFSLLRSFDNAMDAHLLKIALHDRGVESFIFDEMMMTLHPLLNGSLGGVKLKVRSSDLEKAQFILHELDNLPYTDEDNRVIRCPKCQSAKIRSGKRSTKGWLAWMSAILSLLLQIFPLYSKFVYQCVDCNNEFEGNEKG